MNPLLDFELERAHGYPSRLVIGVDEVGRGCLAGPVVAAAVCLPPEWADAPPEWLSSITDSKKLSAPERERLSALIQASSAHWAVAEASVEEVDSLNIYHASLLAMARATTQVDQRVNQTSVQASGLTAHAPAWVLVDGNALPVPLKARATAIVKGDARSLAIAAASIIAKVYRDALCAALDSEYPGYGLGTHKGYPTAEHRAALARLGVSRIHRRTFGPVRELLTSGADASALQSTPL